MKREFPFAEMPLAADSAVMDAATQWVLRRANGLTPAEHGELDHWLAADARHVAALTEVERTWTQLNAPRRDGRATVIAERLQARQIRRRRHRRWTMTGLAAAAAIAIGLSLPRRGSEPPGVAGPTMALKSDRRVLSDGSVIELNAGAEIDVAFTPEQRRVTLARGEAFFTVAKDARHPFVVAAGGVQVRAVGTAFAVDCDSRRVAVLVTEGRVAVSATERDGAGSTAEARYVGVGQRASVSMQGGVASSAVDLTTPSPAQIRAALAWQSERIEFTDTPLRDAVAIFNAHNAIPIRLTEPELGARRITGVCWINKPAAFIRMLESGLNLKAVTSADGVYFSSR